MADYDSPWKESLGFYFKSFLKLCFPEIHQEIDWDKGYISRDKELEKLLPESETGQRVVDKLIQVWTKSGAEAWILIHVEVQSQMRPEFPERMFVYHYRLLDRYNRKVVSLAVLGDNRASWRPDCYRDELLGCELAFRFPIVKLLDYTNHTEQLEKSDNPFSILVLAHLKSLATKSDLASRYEWKFRLVKGMYEKGWSKDRIRSLFRFIDWMIELPIELAKQFKQQLSQFEEENHMPYVTSVERLAREEGREEGLLEGIESVLEIRFGADALSIMVQIRQLSSVTILEQILQASKTIERPADLARLWAGKVTTKDGE